MSIAEYPFQVHPNQRDHTTSLGDQIDAMSDSQRWELLHWLSGYAPNSVERAISHRREQPSHE